MAADIYDQREVEIADNEEERESKVHFHNRVKYLAECLFRNFQWFQASPPLPPLPPLPHLHARELK